MSDAIRAALEARLAEAGKLNDAAKDRAFTEEERTSYDALVAEARDLRSRLDDAAVLAPLPEARSAEAAAKDAEVRSIAKAPEAEEGEKRHAAGSLNQKPRDPGHYRGTPDSHGWLSDQFRAHRYGDQEARQRLEESDRHGIEWRKNEGAEFRDLTHATDTDGGSLTPVMYLQEFHAQLRRAGGATLDICRKIPLPVGTDQLSIPVMSTGVSSSIATENNAVSETDIVWGTNVTADVVYRSSLQDISLQLLEQSNPAVEQVVLTDIMKALVVGADGDILNGTTPEGILNADGVGTETYTAGTATFQGLYARIIAAVNDVYGSYFGVPSHIIMHPRRWAWMLGQVDGDNRPHLGFNPVNSAGANGPLAAEGVVGNLVGIPVVADPNMPTTLGAGTDEDAIAVVVGDELFLAMREPKLEVDFSAGFKSLQATCRGYLPYAFTAERYPGSISLITGTGLNDTL